MKQKLKDRALDLALLVLVGVIAVGVFYAYAMIKGHMEFDAQIIKLLQANQPAAAQQAPAEAEGK